LAIPRECKGGGKWDSWQYLEGVEEEGSGMVAIPGGSRGGGKLDSWQYLEGVEEEASWIVGNTWRE
jgi:hypothetical protein